MQSPFLYDYNTVPPPPPPPPLPPASTSHSHFPIHIFVPLLAAGILFTLAIVCAIVYRKLSNKRTAPADLQKPPQTHRFSYSVLKRATSSFAASNQVGQGGFGSVYKGTLPSGEEIAVKVMDSSGSLQGDREFHNELTLSSRIDTLSCPQVVSFLGFSYEKRSRKRVVLVFEYMPNGNLQDAMLDRKCPELMQWEKRFRIILDVAKGIEYLHNSCDPPIVHGDIKPSNILLDSKFDAKIADFGLAQVLNKDEIWGAFVEDEGGNNGKTVEDHGSIIEENESVLTEEVVVNVYESPENSSIQILDASPSEGLESKTNNTSERWFDRLSIDSKNRRGIGRKRSESGRDWWWKQDNVNGGSESGRIKDYVMEWIGSEIRKERPKKDWIATNSKAEGVKLEKKQKRKIFNWWASLYKKEKIKKKKSKKPREWWKEEFCEELAKKKKKKKKKNWEEDMWWQRDEDLVPERKKRKKWGSIGSFDGFSGEFRRDSKDFASGEIPKSGGISSTPSMRGTVCYIAPEYGGGGQVSRKCDVYSFGVLVLVLVSGRRPLQITASPMSEFDRANLISWAKQLAISGKLNELIDPANTLIHETCNQYARELPAIIIGLDYRLAPEHRLPAAYEDTVDTIFWIKNQFLDENGDKWLKTYGDPLRCYLYGISNGGNVAFHAALRALDLDLNPIKIIGLILNQPLFGGKQRTKAELKYATDLYFPLPVVDLIWELALPKGADRDHRYCNPLIDDNIKEKMKNLGRCLVIGFGGDSVIDRQQDLVQLLVLQGVLVEARFDNVGFHLIDTIDQRRAAAIISFVKEFVSQQ